MWSHRQDASEACLRVFKIGKQLFVWHIDQCCKLLPTPGDDLDDEEASLVARFAPAADVCHNSLDINDNFENDNRGLSEDDNESPYDTEKDEENGENGENTEDDDMGHEDKDHLGDFGGGINNGVSSLGFFL